MTLARRTALSGLVVVCLIGLAVASYGEAMPWLGHLLTNYELPQNADMIVVIGGDWRGFRILKGAELAREGFASKVLSSGGGMLYGVFESDLAIDYAVKHGYSRDLFLSFHYAAASTRDEARAVIPELRRLGVHKYLLVTSELHTARAGRVFRREGKDLEVHVIAAPDPLTTADSWWRDRGGQKAWFLEMLKTLADFARV